MNLDNRQNRNSLEFNCRWQATFQRKHLEHSMMGYLLSWSGCGGLKLKADAFQLSAPTVSVDGKKVCGPTIKCAGIIESLSYAGTPTGPISMRVFLHKEMAADIRNHFSKPFTNLSVKLAWLIVDYDPSGKSWYGASHLKNPKEAEAVLDTVGGTPQIFLDAQPTLLLPEAGNSGYVRLAFQLVPAAKKKTELEFAAGATERWINTWGTSK